MIGWAFRQLVIWGGLGLLVYAFVGNRELLMPRDDGQAVAAVSAPAAQPNPNPALSNSLTYHADQRGHVVLEGAVNRSALSPSISRLPAAAEAKSNSVP